MRRRQDGVLPVVPYAALAPALLVPETVRRVEPPIPVDAWQPAGVLDAWVRENSTLVGRVRLDGGRFVWIRETELRPSEAEAV